MEIAGIPLIRSCAAIAGDLISTVSKLLWSLGAFSRAAEQRGSLVPHSACHSMVSNPGNQRA